jgi:hypothetical protein
MKKVSMLVAVGALALVGVMAAPGSASAGCCTIENGKSVCGEAKCPPINTTYTLKPLGCCDAEKKYIMPAWISDYRCCNW